MMCFTSRAARPATIALIALMVAAGACRDGGEDSAPVADSGGDAALPSPEVTEGPTAAPTVVERIPPTATPTVDPAAEPFHPIESAELPGVPVPIGAELVDFSPASETTDARADFAMPEATDEEIAAWFLEWMPEHGWDAGEERDGGGLVFLHGEQLSERFATQGLERTATLVLETLDDGIDFSLLVEAPAE